MWINKNALNYWWFLLNVFKWTMLLLYKVVFKGYVSAHSVIVMWLAAYVSPSLERINNLTATCFHVIEESCERQDRISKGSGEEVSEAHASSRVVLFIFGKVCHWSTVWNLHNAFFAERHPIGWIWQACIPIAERQVWLSVCVIAPHTEKTL